MNAGDHAVSRSKTIKVVAYIHRIDLRCSEYIFKQKDTIKEKTDERRSYGTARRSFVSLQVCEYH